MTSCRLALFLANDGDFQELLWESCQEAANRHGLPVRAFWADNDSQKQLRQIQSCLNEPDDQRPTVVLTSPIREVALISTAHTAARLGVGWVLLQRWAGYIADLRQQFPRLPIFSVTADQEAIGRIQGTQFKLLLPRGGKLVYVRGPLGTSSAMRRFAGVQQVLRDSQIELIAINGDWTVEGARKAVDDWLSTLQARGGAPKLLKFIVGAQNDAMAVGARAAFERAAHDRPEISVEAIAFCGCDGSPGYGQRLVTEGKLTSTVIMPPSAGIAVREIAAMLAGDQRPPAQIVLTPLSFPDLRVLDGLVA